VKDEILLNCMNIIQDNVDSRRKSISYVEDFLMNMEELDHLDDDDKRARVQLTVLGEQYIDVDEEFLKCIGRASEP